MWLLFSLLKMDYNSSMQVCNVWPILISKWKLLPWKLLHQNAIYSRPLILDMFIYEIICNILGTMHLYLAWRRGGLGGPYCSPQVPERRLWWGGSQVLWPGNKWQEKRFKLDVRGSFLWKGLLSIETNCPGKWLSHLPHICECIPGST